MPYDIYYYARLAANPTLAEAELQRTRDAVAREELARITRKADAEAREAQARAECLADNMCYVCGDTLTATGGCLWCENGGVK